MSDFPYIDLDRVKWADCNLSGGDCITPKGFTFLRLRISDGLWVDLYNLHTDAGSEAGDINARSMNFAQVSAYIAKWSAGMPIIVMGDTNARYTRPGDSQSLRTFLSSTGTTDLWVSNVRGGTFPTSGSDALVCSFPFAPGTTQEQMNACEVVDKMFIRGSPAVSFTTSTYTNAHNAFVVADAPLSDHYPILSTLTWKLSSSVRLGDAIGGPHGDTFNALASLFPESTTSSIPRLTSITLRGANRLDAVSYTVNNGNGFATTLTHGGTGGSASTLIISSGERIVQAKACSGQYNSRTRVFYLLLTTNTGKTVAAGKATSDCLTTSVPTDVPSSGSWSLIGFWGRSGDEVDRIAPIWAAGY